MLNPQVVPLKTVFTVSLLLALASVLSHQFGLDRWLEHDLYLWEGGSGGGFPWRDNYWLYNVVHQGGRALVKRLFFINFGFFVCSWFVDKLAVYRMVFLYIALATVFSTSLISYLKHITTIPCPQSLLEYGGNRHWINIWQLFSADLPRGKCYPAGHSSGGYGWLCLAFLFPYRSKSFYWALVPGLALGLVFGISQQLRGAHFLSHDLITIALCWLFSGLMFYFMRGVTRLIRAQVKPRSADTSLVPVLNRLDH